jgi:polyhydroxybutyrate depolymerase
MITVAAVLVAAGAVRFRRAQPLDGTSTRHITVGGASRMYLLHAGGEVTPGRPLVLVLHGWRGRAVGIERRTRGTFDKLADRDGAIVAYPEALGDPRWNDGWPTDAAPAPDDVGFLAALIDALAVEFGIDRRRVYAAGFSNGASMVYRLACERPELFAAVAPISGDMSAPVAGACPRGAPVAIIAMHGTDDPLVPFGDQQQNDIRTWVRRDGCPDKPSSSQLPDTDPHDGTRTRIDLYAPCAIGTAVAFYTIEGGGHAWPGGERIWTVARHGDTPRDFDAAAVIWDFFQKHPRR